MIDPVWKKQYNVATLKILNAMSEMEEKWRQKYGNDNSVQNKERGYGEQSGNSDNGNPQVQPGTQQVISGGGNQYPGGGVGG